ncbi:hypothetical protein ORIO_19770 (plasmid) [Cereibacter azotoformans]|uniref:hypothetical protein n=1 Tax=Cereibacter azotoformans TaxID=43057 RepID=UPI001EEAAA59|nr:hypothetical protein [Cereibacter azotoformans]ULB12056.1 hypothetical protein ORIO_19770 [Cereibacter azotoformans]
MLISPCHQFIFLKSHKTTSTSVESVLEVLRAPNGHQPQHQQAEIMSEHGYVSGRMGGWTVNDFLKAHAAARVIERKVGPEIGRVSGVVEIRRRRNLRVN